MIDSTKYITGAVVLSVAGRDKGGYFLIVKVIDDGFVLVADGDTHKLERPKKKRMKHLKPNGDVIGKLAEKLQDKKPVFDAEIRSNLKQYNKMEVDNAKG